MKRISLTTIKSFVWRAAFIMLMLVMVSSHFASGFAAKFTSGVSGSDTGRVASFDGGTVEKGHLKPHEIVDIELPSAETTTYYAFSASFRIIFKPCEVARQFNFDLYYTGIDNSEQNQNNKVLPDRVTLYCPAIIASNGATLKRLDPANVGVTDADPFPAISDGSLASVMNLTDEGEVAPTIPNSVDTIAENYVYYGYKVVEGAYTDETVLNDELNKVPTTWAKASATNIAGDSVQTVNSEGTTVTATTTKTTITYPGVTGTETIPMEGAVYEYTFIFFIDGTSEIHEAGTSIEYESQVKFDLDCWQVD